MATVGQELKRERELRGISLKEIADSTKVSLRFLRALENDQLEILPGKFFTKGIIRSYADYIGLESDKILDIYYENLRAEKQKEGENLGKKTAEKERSPKKKKFSKAAAWTVFGLAAAAIVLFAGRLIFFPRNTEPIIVPTQTEISPSPYLDLSTQAEPDGIRIDIRFKELTWVRIFADGELVLNGLQPAGKITAFQAENSVVINTGNAGGIIYSLNGRPGIPLGESGEVAKDIRITPDNMNEFFKKKNSLV